MRIGEFFRALGISTVLLVSPFGARADSIVTTDAFLPAVHLRGATGEYRTDIEIFNPEPSTNARVDLYYTPADRDGGSLPGFRITPDLAPRESVSLVDVVDTIFRQTGTYGLVEVRSSVPVIVTSNTFNVAGASAGTYGQFSPGQPYRNAVGFDDSVFGDLYVTGLPNDSDHRTNAVLMNPSNVTLEAGVQLVDQIGQIYGTHVYRIPPYSMHQLNDVFGGEFAAAHAPAGRPYRLNMFVNLSNGARLLGYGTVTDLRTGDPYLIPAQLMTQDPAH
jgi:hypothetical protein